MRGTPLEKLLAIWAKSNVGAAKDLEEVLTLVHAPADLPGGLKVFRKLSRILLIARADGGTKQDRDRSDRYLRALFWTIHNGKSLASNLFATAEGREAFLKSTGSNPMLSRGAKNHGLWTLLWEHCSEQALVVSFRTLQLHATLSHMAVVNYWVARGKWNHGSLPATSILSSMYDDTLAIRHFVMPEYKDKKEYISVLIWLGVQRRIMKHRRKSAEIPASDLISALQDFAAPHIPARSDVKPACIYKDLSSIIWLLKRRSTPEKLRQPRKASILPSPDPVDKALPEISVESAFPPEPLPITVPISEFELDRSPVDEVVEELEYEKSEGISDHLEDNDEPGNDEDEPLEPDSGIEIYRRHQWSTAEIQDCVRSGTHPEDELTSDSIYLSHRKTGPRGGGSWAAIENQLFPWSPQEIPFELLADGMQVLQNIATQGRRADIELYALASIILRLGATGKTMQKLVVRSDYPSKPESVTLVLQTWKSANPSEWIIPALPLDLVTQLEPQFGCKKCDDAFVLPDYTSMGTVMSSLVNLQSDGAWDGTPRQPFDRPADEYDRQLKDCFNREAPDRAELLRTVFTFSRLGETRFRRLYRDAGENVVPATYLTRRKHRTGEVTRFYETLEVGSLQRLDRLSLAGMCCELNKVGLGLPFDRSLLPTRSSGYIGSPFCPSAGALADFFIGLREKLRLANANLAEDFSFTNLSKVHNLYITYCYAGYNLATGHRAVIGGYSAPEQVEWRSMFLGIRDKGLRTRLIPVSGTAFAQMQLCARYLELFESQFLKHAPTPSLYFLDEDLHVIEISESSLRNHLPFVANFGRHFVCSFVAENILNGNDQIAIDHLKEFLGHAAEGEDRTAPHSAFDYGRYAKSMGEVLRVLLDQVRFWPINIWGERQQEYEPELERAFDAGTT